MTCHDKVPTREGQETDPACTAVGGHNTSTRFNVSAWLKVLSHMCEFQECHSKAWQLVGAYMESNLCVIAGKASEAESTMMPRAISWVQEMLADIPEVRETDDHAVLLWLNLPSAGIISAQKWEVFVTLVANMLSLYRRNGIALIIHSNRAGQVNHERTRVCNQLSMPL